MESLDTARLSRADLKKEDRERDNRIRRLLILLLLLLLLLFALVFAFLALFSDLFKPAPTEGIEHLFSIYGFNRPLGVGTDSDGRVMVADTGNTRFVVFDQTGAYQFRIDSRKTVERFYGVINSHFDDKEKKLYVADFRRRAVTVYSSKGKRLDRWPKVPGAPPYGALGFSPFDITEYKGRLYVLSNNGIFAFTKKGKLVKEWGSRGTGTGEFDYPVALEIDDKGVMFIADQLNRRVVAMDQKGAVKWTLGQPDQAGKAGSFFGLPRGVAIDNEGRVFISDTFHHELVVLSRSGRLIGTVGRRGVEDAQLNFPEAISFRPDGALYIADRENNRIQAWRIHAIKKPSSAMRKRYSKYFNEAKG